MGEVFYSYACMNYITVLF